MAAIKTDGTLWTWGQNTQGQLGNGNGYANSSPAQTIAAGTNWKSVAAGYFGSFSGIKTDGTLWGWGYNGFGGLGTNDTTNRSSPVQTVAGGTNWKQASISGYMSFGIKTDGTLWTWGYNGAGGLGTNDRTNRSSPVQTVAGGTNWKQASAGSSVLTAIYFYDAGNLYPSA
jgi:alpha-tubulin suppressor-like RCC1 family protein